MTIHEEQPVTAEPRIDDENTADAVHEPETDYRRPYGGGPSRYATRRMTP